MKKLEIKKKKTFTHTYKEISVLLLTGKVTTITFLKEKKIVRQPINTLFLRTKNNKRVKTVKELTDDLHAIKHDMGALDYQV